MKLLTSRPLTVIAAATVLGVVGAGGAVAGGLITGKQIAANTVTSNNIKDGTLKQKDLAKGVKRKLNAKAVPGPAGPAGPEGPAGPAGQDGKDGKDGVDGTATYAGANWQLIDRNTIGNGFAALRSGPNSANFGVTVTVPLGVGSLGLQTGSNADKVAFGNQVDFAGVALSTVNTIKYSAYVTGEDLDKYLGNIPNVSMEVLTTGTSGYSTLNYVPPVFATKADGANKWTEYDGSTAAQWYLTGAAATSSGCNQATYCTLAQVKAAFPDATIQTLQINKGRDYAFQGAVDKLVFNADTYDFEPFGVTKQ